MGVDIQISSVTEDSEDLESVIIKNNVMFTGSKSNCVYVYDISDPSDPILIDTLGEPSSNVKDLVYKNNVLFVVDTGGYIHIYDISDILTPQHIKSIVGTANAFYAVAVSDNILITGDTGYRIKLFDISDPINPDLLTNISEHAGNVECLSVYNDMVISGAHDNTAKLFDISDPNNPELLSSLEDHTNSVYSVFIEGTLAFTGSNDNSFKIYDISDPSNPVLLSNNNTETYCLSLYKYDNLLFVGTQYKEIYDISDPSNPIIIYKDNDYHFQVRGSYFDPNLNLWATASWDSSAKLYDINRFRHDFIDITFADYPEIRFRGNPLKTDNTITEIEVYVNETLENSYTADLDQIKTLTINTPDLVDGDNWITILGYDDQGNESAATVLISDDYFKATNFEYDQENYRFVMPDDKLHAEAAWGKHDVGFITDGIRFFQDRSIIEMIPVISNASSGDTTINLKRIGRVETEVVN
jgi:hypothetical protein